MHCLSRNPRSYLLNSYSDVKERDTAKRESYEATWLDLVMETRPEYKATLVERDLGRKERYEQKCVRHFVVRRFPRQMMCIGLDGMDLQEFRIPYNRVLPIPIFVPRDVTPLQATHREASPTVIGLEKRWDGKIEECFITNDQKHQSSSEFRACSLVTPARDRAHDF